MFSQLPINQLKAIVGVGSFIIKIVISALNLRHSSLKISLCQTIMGLVSDQSMELSSPIDVYFY